MTTHTETRTITARTITDPMIRALRGEAGAAGDEEQVKICDRALARRGGRGECANMPTYKETIDARHEAMEALEHAKLRAAVVAVDQRSNPDDYPLPDTHDALKLLTYSLELPMLERGTGDTCELFSINAPRSLRVWWCGDRADHDSGWMYETKRGVVALASDSLDTVDELRTMLEWVEGERAALAAGEAG